MWVLQAVTLRTQLVIETTLGYCRKPHWGIAGCNIKDTVSYGNHTGVLQAVTLRTQLVIEATLGYCRL